MGRREYKDPKESAATEPAVDVSANAKAEEEAPKKPQGFAALAVWREPIEGQVLVVQEGHEEDLNAYRLASVDDLETRSGRKVELTKDKFDKLPKPFADVQAVKKLLPTAEQVILAAWRRGVIGRQDESRDVLILGQASQNLAPKGDVLFKAFVIKEQ